MVHPKCGSSLFTPIKNSHENTGRMGLDCTGHTWLKLGDVQNQTEKGKQSEAEQKEQERERQKERERESGGDRGGQRRTEGQADTQAI